MKLIKSAIFLSLSVFTAQVHFILASYTNQEQKNKSRKLRGGKPQEQFVEEQKASGPPRVALDSPTSSHQLFDEEELMAFNEEDTEAAALEYTPETIEYDKGELEAMYEEELAMREYGRSNEEEAMMGAGLDTEEASEYEIYMMGLLDGEEEDGSSEEYDMYGEEDAIVEYTSETIQYGEGDLEDMYYGPDEEEEEELAMMEYGSSESIMGLDAEETLEYYGGGEFESMYDPDEEDEGLLEMELEEMMMGLGLDAEEELDSSYYYSSED